MRYQSPQMTRLRRGRVISKLGAMLRGGVRTTSIERDRHQPDGDGDGDVVGHEYLEQELPVVYSKRVRNALLRFVGGVARRVRSVRGGVNESDCFHRAPTDDVDPHSADAHPQRPALISKDGHADTFTSSTRTRTVSFNSVVKVSPHLVLANVKFGADINSGVRIRLIFLDWTRLLAWLHYQCWSTCSNGDWAMSRLYMTFGLGISHKHGSRPMYYILITL